MKLMKRATALLLCFLMLTNGPISAFATEGADDVVVETTTTTETVETCEECGGSDAHTDDCSFNIVAPLTTEAPDETTEPTTTPTVVTEPTVTTGSAISTDPVGCTECNQTEGHLESCSQYVAPTEETTEPTVSGNDVVGCTECGATEGHLETCSQYEAPVEDIAETDGPQVGDKIWIKHNSYVYKSQSAENGHKLLLNYEVEIVNIITDENGNALWYEFAFTTTGIGEWFIQEYKYVQVENTSVDEHEPSEPVDENACNCGENAPENIANHADSCPRKQYIKTLFENRTADEIYVEWETYDEATQTDLLNMLQIWDNTKYEALKKLLEAPAAEKEVNISGAEIVITGLPEDVSVEGDDTLDDLSDEHYIAVLSKWIFNKNAILFSYDLTTKDADGQIWQPEDGNLIAVTIPVDLEDGRKIGIIHEHEGTYSKLGEYVVENGCITVQTQGFSAFIGYDVDFEYNGKHYLLPGGGDLLLSELIAALEISGTPDENTAVSSVTDGLMTYEWNASHKDGVITFNQDFDHEEILTITFGEENSYQIIVTCPTELKYLDEAEQTTVTLGETSYTANNELIDRVSDLTIYAKPGMAIGFDNDLTWPESITGCTMLKDQGGNYYAVLPAEITRTTSYSFTLTSQNELSISGEAREYKVTIWALTQEEPTLLKDALNGNERYSIATVPATLYNYDGLAFNKYYNEQPNQELEKGFVSFVSKSLGKDATNGSKIKPWASGANSGGSDAKMGIVSYTLDPVTLLPVTKGQNADFFSTTESDFKKVYENVQFEFVYDDATDTYMYYSSLTHAQLDERTNTVKLYEQSLSPMDGKTSHGAGGFYPFTNIYEGYTNSQSPNHSLETKLQHMVDNKNYVEYPSDIAKDTVQADTNGSTVDMHFGLKLEAPFYLPMDKKLNGNEMKYEFSGDDDLWVFIDDTLVLDIGGGHTAVNGSFNLTTGDVTISRKTVVRNDQGGWYGDKTANELIAEAAEYIKSLEGGKMHTIRIFYLERHSGVSNCRMKFNLPIIANAVMVSKELTDTDGEEMSISPDTDYTFKLYQAEDLDSIQDQPDEAFEVMANRSYRIGEKSFTTSTDGTFTLKAGETAVFYDVPKGTEIYAEEILPEDGAAFEYVSTKVIIDEKNEAVLWEENTTKPEGSVVKTGKMVMPNATLSFDFKNSVKANSLYVVKEVVGGADGLQNPYQEFQFMLQLDTGDLGFFDEIIVNTTTSGRQVLANADPNGDGIGDGGIFRLKQGETASIQLPAGVKYTVYELQPDATFQPPQKKVQTKTGDGEWSESTAEIWQFGSANDTLGRISGTIESGKDTKITFVNSQLFDLVITKKGIEQQDHDLDTEVQSTIYEVTGPNDFKLQVTIVGNDSVTIKGLAGGVYQVRELVDWSWRYTTATPSVTTGIAKAKNGAATVTFTNSREETKWLSGDSYVENWWNIGTIKKRNGSDEVIEDEVIE